MNYRKYDVFKFKLTRLGAMLAISDAAMTWILDFDSYTILDHLAWSRTRSNQGQIFLERPQIEDVNFGVVAPFCDSSHPMTIKSLQLNIIFAWYRKWYSVNGSVESLRYQRNRLSKYWTLNHLFPHPTAKAVNMSAISCPWMKRWRESFSLYNTIVWPNMVQWGLVIYIFGTLIQTCWNSKKLMLTCHVYYGIIISKCDVIAYTTTDTENMAAKQ